MRPNDYNDLLKKIKCTDDFRSRMQEKLSSPSIEVTEYEDSVSGTDVITAKHRFGRAAALAAAFVLVCGAVGGGAYYLARINNKTEESTNINTDEKASVYSRLKANKDCYNAEIRLWEDLSGDIYSKSNIDKDKIFEYLDHFDMSKGIEADDFTSTLRGIKIFFNGTDDKAKGVTYSFELFDNGELRLTEKVKSEERVSYHSYVDGQRVFNDILYMLVDDEEAIAEFEKVTNKELENEITNGFKNNPYDKAYYYIADENRQEEYTLTGRESFAHQLMAFEWERASVISGDVNQYYLGFAATEDGYLQFSSGMTYKLKNDSDLESFKSVLASHLKLNEFGTDASKEDILNAFHEGYNGGRARFRVDDGQFTEETECTLENFESFKDEISELEWVTCETSNRQIYRDFYVAGALISRNGYLYPQSGGTHQCAYKLKNESDIEKLCEICDKYITKNTNENANENDSIYSKLTANKENYSVDLDDDIKKKDIDKDILFEYLDKYDMTSEIGPSSYTSSDKKITVFFRKIGEEKKNYSYVGATERYDYKLVIYDTGTFTWTENDNGKEKLTMHRFDDGGKIYQDIIDIFADR